MTMYGRSCRWAAALALGLAGLTGAGAATVDAAPARSAASTFELTLDARDTTRFEGDAIDFTRQGTFSSRAPFCTTGDFDQVEPRGRGSTADGMTWRFTCDDETGSITVSIPQGWYASAPVWNTKWHILDGSGSYAGLHGRGSLQGEVLSGSFTDGWTATESWLSTFQGVVDRDAVAPSIAISSARAVKLRRAAGAYSIKVAMALRDDVTDNPVSYTLRASAGGFELARRVGTASTGAVSMTLRIRPILAGARTVRLQLIAEDPVGNEVAVERALRLPR